MHMDFMGLIEAFDETRLCRWIVKRLVGLGPNFA